MDGFGLSQQEGMAPRIHEKHTEGVVGRAAAEIDQ